MLSLALPALLLSAHAAAYATPSHLGRRAADAQTSLSLDPTQVQKGLASNGQQGTGEPGQVPSLTSTNNFINFCLTQNTVLTNGVQTLTGSCNPTIMGRIMASDKYFSSKFAFPVNGGTVTAKQTFTIKMNVKNVNSGHFVNPKTNYYAAPCQVDANGLVIGHSHVTVELMTSMGQTSPPDPNVFAFFKGINGAAQNGQLSADVTGGLAAGVYRMCSINACANHQPVLGAAAQHGNFDDCVYFTATADGKAAATPAAAASAAPAKAAAPAAPPKAAAPVAAPVVAPAKGAAPAAPAAPAAAKAVQTFDQQAGGIAAPAVTGANGKFSMNGQTFTNAKDAVVASCDAQQTACSRKADLTGDLGGFDQNTCRNQHTACVAAAGK